MNFRDIWLPGNLTSREMFFQRKCDFLGNRTSQEMWVSFEIWLPRKFDFPANLNFTGAAEEHGWHGFVNIGLKTFKNTTSQKMLLPWNCDFPGSVTSWELWIPRKNEFNLTLIILVMFATPLQVQYMVSIFFLKNSFIWPKLWGKMIFLFFVVFCLFIIEN